MTSLRPSVVPSVRPAIVFSLMTLLLMSVQAYGYTPDPQLLRNKGYSPMSVRAITLQTAHQQWETPPAPIRTPWQQVKRNIYINDWAGDFDEFCATIIRERQ
ncbi:MAG: hypothetical protein IPK79_07900 [Vampirovibrionales bacterium]|nr:hypothetical protein [Vampirovibrionales bacterium]